MRKPTAQEVSRATAELNQAMREAKDTLQEIQDYWRDDPEFYRFCLNRLEDFQAGMNSLSADLDAFLEQAAEQEAPAKPGREVGSRTPHEAGNNPARL